MKTITLNIPEGMKKFILILSALIFFSGCGMTLEEAEEKKKYCESWGKEWEINEMSTGDYFYVNCKS